MEGLVAWLTSIDRYRTLANKVPFVVLVIGSLGVGLGLTLVVHDAPRSYQLSNARERTRMLRQHKGALERDVREGVGAGAGRRRLVAEA